MGPEVQRNPYRDAYMAANAELDEIMEQCARLRARKERIEVAADALRAIVELAAIPTQQPHIQAAHETAPPAPVPARPQAEIRPPAVQPLPASPVVVEPAMKEVASGLEKRLASLLNRTA